MGTELKAPAWGYRTTETDGSRAAWGARAILEGGSYSLLHDRQDAQVTDEKARKDLSKCMKRAMPKARKEADRLISMGEIHPARAAEHVLFEDDGFKVMCNAKASHGYLYLVGFIKKGA